MCLEGHFIGGYVENLGVSTMLHATLIGAMFVAEITHDKCYMNLGIQCDWPSPTQPYLNFI